MSRIEDIIYSAYEHGKRNDLLNEVSKLRAHHPSWPLINLYEEAYQNVMNV
jgi:hypothetical protein